MKTLIAHRGRPPALLFIDSSQWPLDLAALRACIAAAETEPPNVVLVTSRELSDQACYLAILPVRMTTRALHGAARRARAARCAGADGIVRGDPPAARAQGARCGGQSHKSAGDRAHAEQRRPYRHAGRRWRAGVAGPGVREFDIVLMDVNMPVMNGLDAVKLHHFATGGRDRRPSSR